MSDTFQAQLLGALLIGGSLLVYFLPTIAANHHHRVNRNGIAALNLLLGWTFFGWVAALVWELSATSEAAELREPSYFRKIYDLTQPLSKQAEDTAHGRAGRSAA